MELTKSGKGHELSPGAKRLISTHNQKPQLLLGKYACKPKDSHQFCFKNTPNHQSSTAQQIFKKSSFKSSKCKQNKTQYEMKKCSTLNIHNKNNFHQNIKEDVVFPISYKMKIDNQQNSPESLVNYENIQNCEPVKKDTEKYPTSNISHEEVRSTSLTSAEYKKEGKDQLLDNFLLKENDISHKNEQKDLQIRDLSKELETVRSAWHDDKKYFQNKIRELEEKINKKDEEIQELQSLLNQQVGTVLEEITNLQLHTNQFNENQSKEDYLISDQSNFKNFDIGNVNNLYDNAEDEKTYKSDCDEPLKRKFDLTNTEKNGRQKRQAVLNSSKPLYQVATEITPPLTQNQSIQNFVSKENDDQVSNLKNNIETCSEDNTKSPVKVSSVVFDLETNGLKRQYHNVIQISAIDVSNISSNMFNAYICPNSEFDPKASAVNGFYMKNGYLCKNGKKLNTVIEYEAVTFFLDWLKKRKSKCILIAHNGARFDVPRLFDLLKKHDLLNYFGDLVHGFVDTLKLFKSLYPHMDKYTQSHLVKVILDIDYEAHDGIEDVIALAKLITHKTISVKSIINNIDQGPLKANFKDQFMKITCENEVTLKPLHAPNVTHEEILLKLNSVFTLENENKFLNEFSEDVVIDSWEKYSQSKAYDDEEHVMVSFDLETTGLDRYYHEIVQVSAVEVNDLSEKFNIYILPKNEFDPYASKVNGLHLLNGHLCKKYYKLETVSELEGVNAFVTWLSKRKRKCILFAHNGKNFDMPRILDSCRKGDVFELFKSYVIGYVDTLPLFKYLHPGRYKYTQTSLVKDLLHIKYNAHDGLEDVTALAKLLKHKSVTNESIFSHLNSI